MPDRKQRDGEEYGEYIRWTDSGAEQFLRLLANYHNRAVYNDLCTFVEKLIMLAQFPDSLQVANEVDSHIHQQEFEKFTTVLDAAVEWINEQSGDEPGRDNIDEFFGNVADSLNASSAQYGYEFPRSLRQYLRLR